MEFIYIVLIENEDGSILDVDSSYGEYNLAENRVQEILSHTAGMYASVKEVSFINS